MPGRWWGSSTTADVHQQVDEASLGSPLDLREEVQSDAAALPAQAARRAAGPTEEPDQSSPRLAARRRAGETDADEPDLPSLGVSGEIRVRPDRRPEFM